MKNSPLLDLSSFYLSLPFVFFHFEVLENQLYACLCWSPLYLLFCSLLPESLIFLWPSSFNLYWHYFAGYECGNFNKQNWVLQSKSEALVSNAYRNIKVSADAPVVHPCIVVLENSFILWFLPIFFLQIQFCVYFFFHIFVNDFEYSFPFLCVDFFFWRLGGRVGRHYRCGCVHVSVKERCFTAVVWWLFTSFVPQRKLQVIIHLS